MDPKTFETSIIECIFSDYLPSFLINLVLFAFYTKQNITPHYCSYTFYSLSLLDIFEQHISQYIQDVVYNARDMM